MHVAIDGPAGAGKSTIAKELARRLDLIYLDTGAMYRAVAIKAIRGQVPLRDSEKLQQMLDNTQLDVTREDGQQHVYLDGEDVTSILRTPEVSMAASTVSTVGEVRRYLVRMQQALAAGKDVVMDGRDIGTKVLPDAQYKFFLTADDTVRAKRRFDELCEKGQKVRFEDVLSELRARDKQDTTRKESPLVCAKDATIVDSSALSIPEVVDTILSLMGRL